jgi:hypothetical protein
MIDLPWIKGQGAPAWAQHIANEVHELQVALFGEVKKVEGDVVKTVDELFNAGTAAADKVQLAADKSVSGKTGDPLPPKLSAATE